MIQQDGATEARVPVKGRQHLPALDGKHGRAFGGGQEYTVIAAQGNAAVAKAAIVGRAVAKCAGDARRAGERCIGQHGISSVQRCGHDGTARFW